MNRLKYFAIAFILCVSTFTHFYRITQTYNFHNDEGRDALVAKKMIDTGKPVLLGPQTSVGNMYLGPLYYYVMVPPLILSNSDPVGPAVMIALSAIITTYLIFLLGSRWFGWKAGILAGLIFAITPIVVHFTRSSWNPNLVPFIAILSLWSVELAVSLKGRGQIWAYLSFGILAGILFQLHYVAVVFVGLCGLYLLFKKITFTNLAVIFVGFLIASSPFWLFETRHNYVNTRAFFTYASSGGHKDANSPGYLVRAGRNLIGIPADLIGSRPLTDNKSSSWLIYGGLIILVISALTQNGLALGGLLLGSVLLTSVLHESIYAHYLGYLFPVIALLLGNGLANASKWLRLLCWVFFLGYLSIAIPSLISNLNGESSHQAEKGRAVAAYIRQNAGDQPYNLVAAYDNARETTYQYFVSMLDNRPRNEVQQLLYIICEDRPCTQADADNPGVYNRGPAHPSLEDELGHPFIQTSTTVKKMESSTHTVYGVWVARVVVLEP